MLGIIGCGNMGQALIKGLKSKAKGLKLIIFDKNKAKLSRIKKKYKVKSAKTLEGLILSSHTIIIAVKPKNINQVLATIKKNYSQQLIISIAAGISTTLIQKKIAKGVRIMRVMPNLAAQSSMSISTIAQGKNASKADLAKTINIFKCVGECIILKEAQINAATAISGSGPGYIYHFLHCLEEAAKKLGFSKTQAKLLVFNTAKGAINHIAEKDDFLNLVNKVASKGGTTQAAINYFKKKKYKKIIADATKRAYKRAKALAG